MDLDIPKIMGILNVTSDSFYSDSRTLSEEKIRKRILQMVDEGVDIIDVGGCSTRPDSIPVSEEEEMKRVETGCRLVKELAPEIPLSVDTYRSNVAQVALEKYKADIINDVSGGCDSDIWSVVKEYNAIYVLTHNEAILDSEDTTASTITWLSKKVNELHRLGINDVIIDPGFGFGKNIDQNFRIFDELHEISRIGLPVLVGISRKSMIYKTLDCLPEDALAATIALNAIALEKGAEILRVHDVKAAKDTVKIFAKLKNL